MGGRLVQINSFQAVGVWAGDEHSPRRSGINLEADADAH